MFEGITVSIQKGGNSTFLTVGIIIHVVSECRRWTPERVMMSVESLMGCM